MKKQLLILSTILIGLTSCKKETNENDSSFEEYSHTVRFIGLVNTSQGYCRINGQAAQLYNTMTGIKEHKCKSGDRLELKDPGYDIVMYSPGSSIPSVVSEGYVESYIIVDGQIVQSYKGNGNANLIYYIP